MRKLAHGLVGALVTLVAVLSVSAAASAAEGYYQLRNWSTPDLYTARLWSEGVVLSPPATVPVGARITRMTGTFNWNLGPGSVGWRYEGRLCNTAVTSCVAFGTGAGDYWWETDNVAYAGLPADTTSFRIGFRVNDFSSSRILPVLSPSRYMEASTLLVEYEY